MTLYLNSVLYVIIIKNRWWVVIIRLQVVKIPQENGYRIFVKSLRHRILINVLTAVLYKYGVKEKSKKIIIDLTYAEPPSFPNVILPLAGLIKLYKVEYNIDISLSYQNNSYIDEIRIDRPYNLANDSSLIKTSIFDKVLSFDSEDDIEILSTMLLKQLQETVVCKSGVIVGISWCINEIMDNVLNHSGLNEGFIMCQIHRKNNHVAFSIYDYGKGLFNTLSGTEYNPQTTIDAINLALTAGVTRDKKLGQGNGLWGVRNIVKFNLGNLAVYTGNSSYTKDYRESNQYETVNEKLNYPSIRNQTTLIEFSIDFDRSIDINTALGDYEPYEKIQMAWEEATTDDNHIIVYIKDVAVGTGTRRAGERLRKYVTNVLIQNNQPVELNFSEVVNMSSSFADEFAGKLVQSFGVIEFNKCFRVVKYNDYVKILLDKAISQRLALDTRK